MRAPSRGARGLSLQLSRATGLIFLLESPHINASTVLLPGIIRLRGDNKKGTETIFEKFSKAGECHIRPPLAFIFAGLEGGRGEHEAIVWLEAGAKASLL